MKGMVQTIMATNNVNNFEVIGNVGKNGGSFSPGKGSGLGTFSLAHNNNYRADDGNWVKRTSWFNIKAWGPLGEIVGSLMQGQRVRVTGYLTQSKWEKNGVVRSTVELIATNIQLVSTLKKAVTDEGEAAEDEELEGYAGAAEYLDQEEDGEDDGYEADYEEADIPMVRGRAAATTTTARAATNNRPVANSSNVGPSNRSTNRPAATKSTSRSTTTKPVRTTTNGNYGIVSRGEPVVVQQPQPQPRNRRKAS
jgi:single-strand DNA-binding protein